MYNTKQRSQEIQDAAALILIEEQVDITKAVPPRLLAKILATKTGCHYTTAKRHIAKAARRARGELVKSGWGGKRQGSGRPNEKITQPSERTIV